MPQSDQAQQIRQSVVSEYSSYEVLIRCDFLLNIVSLFFWLISVGNHCAQSLSIEVKIKIIYNIYDTGGLLIIIQGFNVI